MTSARVLVELDADERAALAEAWARREARRGRRVRLLVAAAFLVLGGCLALAGAFAPLGAGALGAGAALLVRAFLDGRGRWRRWFAATLGEGTRVFEWSATRFEVATAAGPLATPPGGWRILPLAGGWLGLEGRRPAWFLPAGCVPPGDPPPWHDPGAGCRGSAT